MPVRATDPDSVDLPVGGVWSLGVAVTDADGCRIEDTVTVTVTPPTGGPDTPAVTALGNGEYRAVYVTAAAGRYVARATTASNGAADFTAYVTAVVAAAGMPTLIDLRGDPEADPPTLGYLKRTSATDEEIQEALDAEAANQRRMCKMPAAYGADLRSALMRRVARHLAMKGIPLAVLLGDAETGSTVPPSQDPEVRRFERPYRRLKVG